MVGAVWAHAWRSLVLVVLIVTGSVGTFLSGLGGRPLGWLWAPMVLCVGSMAAAYVAWWNRRGRWSALTTAASVAVLLGVVVWMRSPLGPRALGAALDELRLPAGAELVEQSSGGNVMCFDACPSVHRRYVVRAGAEEVATLVRGSLRDAGYTLQESADRYFHTTLEGELHITGSVNPTPERAGIDVQMRAVANG